MNEQLKAFLTSAIQLLTTMRTDSSDEGYNAWCEVSDLIRIAFIEGRIAHSEFLRLSKLVDSAFDHTGLPFPDARNAGPYMPTSVWCSRHKENPLNLDKPVRRYVNSAALSDSLPGFWVVEFSCGHSGILQAPTHRSPVVGHCSACESAADLSAASALMLCQDCLHVRPYCESGHFGDYHCDCGGDFCGCNSCNDFAHGQGADFEKRQALEAANEKPEPVPAPTPRRQLRLLCVLAKPQLDTAQSAYLPIHTMHRLPPRAMVRGQWSQPRYAGLHLRETQARQPSAAVLARCERHRQTNAFRASARTVRTGAVSA